MAEKFPLAYYPGALVSQEYRILIKENIFSGLIGSGLDEKTIESKIQPASIDTLLEPICYGVPHWFKPENGKTVSETILKLPKEKRNRYEITENGFIAAQDKAWLIPLKGNYQLPEGYWMRSNPKSTQGRLGNKVRLIADGVTSYDNVYGPWQGKLYVLFEPKCWANVIYENLSLNQLRIFCGMEPPLSADQLAARWKPNQLVQTLEKKQLEIPSPSFVHDGVLLTLDLTAKNYHNIAGFSAIESHEPLDQNKKSEWKQYYETIIAGQNGRVEIDSRLKILTSQYIYNVPNDLCAEMTPFMLETDNVRLHDAGFFDPGFYGTVTFEVENLGNHPAVLDHGQSAGRIVFYRNRTIPDKKYGDKETGSHYCGQLGPRLPKQFGEFKIENFSRVARSNTKTRQDIYEYFNKKNIR